MFNKYIKKQHVCISVSELFDWWDRLDSDPDNAFELFTEFLEQAEDTLDVNPKIFEDDVNRDEYILLDNDDLFETDYDEFAKRTNDAYKRVMESNSEPCTVTKFLEELDEWTHSEKDSNKLVEFDENLNNSTISYNPYNWNIKRMRNKK